MSEPTKKGDVATARLTGQDLLDRQLRERDRIEEDEADQRDARDAARKRVSVNPEVEAKLRAVEEKVWIPAVPLPFIGITVDICGQCRKKFRFTGRRHRYELHYRREHQRGDTNADAPQVLVTRAEAKRIYAEVNADSVGTTSDQVQRGR